jgi:cytochrome c553
VTAVRLLRAAATPCAGVTVLLASGLLASGLLASGLLASGESAHARRRTRPAPPPADFPAWAYPVGVPAPTAPPSAADSTPQRVPGSAVVLPLAATRDLFLTPDWFPGAAPPMPGVVARGRRPSVYACGHCHLANGQGHPENASLAGLPAVYLAAQVEEFRSGRRASSEPRMRPAALMRSIAQHATPEEVAAASAYFARLAPRRWTRVVETRTVPRTRLKGASMLVADEGGGREPIGRRIVELPEDLRRRELRDPTSGFVAYVPTGSVARGRALARGAGAGRDAHACAGCHGSDLRGAGDVPGLSGRSPTSLVRQLYDFRTGARTGPRAAPMAGVARALSTDQMVDVAAYLASRAPL